MKKLLYILLLLTAMIQAQNPTIIMASLGEQPTPLDADLYPVLSNFRVEAAYDNRVYFDSSEDVQGGTATGYSISGFKGIASTYINIGNTTGHYFVLNSPTFADDFTFYDNNTINYINGANIRDMDDNYVRPFSLQHIKNNLAEPDATDHTYYVDGSVGSSGNGLTEGAAFKTIQEGITAIDNEATSEGSTLYIKAYNYGNEHITMNTNGTAAKPIKIIGYKVSPGDITSMYYNYARGVGLTTSEMPTFTGSSSGIALNIQSDYVIYRNLQFTNYDRMFINEQGGVTDGVTGNIIDNCIGYKNSNYAEGNGNIIGFKGMTSDNNRIINTIAVNTTMIGISMRGYFSLVDNCKVYADDLMASSDYYFDIKGGDNIIINNLAHQAYDNTHGGHGIALKSRAIDNSETYTWASENTLIEDCTVINIQQAVHLSHKETKNNIVRGVDISNPGNFSSVAGISFLGSLNNIAENITYDSDTGEAVKFTASNEDVIYSYGANNNIVKNSTFARGSVVVLVDEFDSVRNIFDNKIINCTFDDFYYLEDNDAVTGTHTGNELINCIINNCDVLKANGGNALHTTQTYTAFNALGFTTPTGTGNVSANPNFTDSANGDFTLSASTPTSISEGGITRSDIEYDKRYADRTVPYSIGAYEKD